MKILLINQDWFRDEFREAGHEVLSCGFAPHLDFVLTQALIHIDDIIKALPGGFRPDVLVFHDNSSPVMISGLDDTDIPSVFYSVDAHHHAALHRYLTHIFDRTFVAQKDYIPEMASLGREVEWMPLYASRLGECSEEKKYGAVFVGSLDPALNPDRVKFFEELKKHVPVFCITGDWSTIFPYAEIVINQTVKGDLNFRVFEAMGCGAMLLTERSPNGLLELFQDGRHLVTYEKGNVEQAAGLIQSYLSDIKKCRETAAAGRLEIVEKHLARHRAQRFLEVMSGLARTQSPMRHWAAVRNFSNLATILERRGDRGNAARALLHALKSAETALSRGEKLTEDAALYFVLAAVLFDRELCANSGQQLLNLASEAYPQLPVIGLARIKMLCDGGRREEALAVARQVNPTVDEVGLISGANSVIATLLSQALGH